MALSQYAPPSSYEPHTDASPTDLFGLLTRTIEFSYSPSEVKAA